MPDPWDVLGPAVGSIARRIEDAIDGENMFNVGGALGAVVGKLFAQFPEEYPNRSADFESWIALLRENVAAAWARRRN